MGHSEPFGAGRGGIRHPPREIRPYPRSAPGLGKHLLSGRIRINAPFRFRGPDDAQSAMSLFPPSSRGVPTSRTRRFLLSSGGPSVGLALIRSGGRWGCPRGTWWRLPGSQRRCPGGTRWGLQRDASDLVSDGPTVDIRRAARDALGRKSPALRRPAPSASAQDRDARAP